MSADPQMFDHTLNGIKGWPGPWACDYEADLDSSVDPDDVKAGMVVSVDPTNGTFILGVAAPTKAAGYIRAPMGYFLLQNATDFDVVGTDGNFVGATADGLAPRLSGLAASGAFELESTEYVAGTYQIGDLLSAITTTSAAGKLNHAIGNAFNTAVANVSKSGPSANAQNKDVLRFHTVFVPFFLT